MNLSGAITAMITPFTDGQLDPQRLREQIEFQIDSGPCTHIRVYNTD